MKKLFLFLFMFNTGLCFAQEPHTCVCLKLQGSLGIEPTEENYLVTVSFDSFKEGLDDTASVSRVWRYGWDEYSYGKPNFFCAHSPNVMSYRATLFIQIFEKHTSRRMKIHIALPQDMMGLTTYIDLMQVSFNSGIFEFSGSDFKEGEYAWELISEKLK